MSGTSFIVSARATASARKNASIPTMLIPDRRRFDRAPIPHRRRDRRDTTIGKYTA